MPAKIQHFLHNSVVTGAQVLGTSFDLAGVHDHDFTSGAVPFLSQRNFRGIVSGIHIKLTSATSATTVTIRLCEDAAGDFPLVPDTVATLVAGVTTAATKCAAYSVDLPLFQSTGGPGNGSLFLFAKVDDATTNPVFAQSCVTWQE